MNTTKMSKISDISTACRNMPTGSAIVNDKHSRLNATVVKERLVPTNVTDLRQALKQARATGQRICVAGGRHAMGGQQFLNEGLFVDTQTLNRVIDFDHERGLIEVESGMQWPALIDFLRLNQSDRGCPWTIRQKQTGCDMLSIGGALSANVHGRGLSQAPFVDDVEDIRIVTSDGQLVRCNRAENRELFGLAIGGYGLFGLIYSATLRLTPRRRLQRSVELASAADAVALLELRRSEGATHGDFQFDIDDNGPGFLLRGIVSTYAPVADDMSMPNSAKVLAPGDWSELVYLAHTDKKAAFDKYVRHYLATDGQLYWSDTFQLSTYIEQYHSDIDRLLPQSKMGTELISEVYVPRSTLGLFLEKAAGLLKREQASVIYGTVRLIQPDVETFLPWATEPWACVVFNLHVEHSDHGLAAAKRSFCGLIDLALDFRGSYYLTYHRFAGAAQLLACYPQMPNFLDLKQKFDPDGIFVSDWYRHVCHLLGAAPGTT